MSGWYDSRSEFASVGCMLLSPEEVVGHALGVLRIDHEAWFDVSLQAIVRHVFAFVKEGKFIDALTISASLNAEIPDSATTICHPLANGAGWFNVCLAAVDSAISPHGYKQYLEQVRAGHIERKLGSVCLRIAASTEKVKPPEDVDAEAFSAAEEISTVASPRVTMKSNREIMDQSTQAWKDATAYRNGDLSKKPASGLAFPWDFLTKKTSGLEPDIFLLGGRPSAGKTTLECQTVEHVCATTGKTVLRWTMDSQPGVLLQRMTCRKAGVSLPKLKQGHGYDKQMHRVEKAVDEISTFDMKFHTGNDYHEGLAWIRAMVAKSEVVLLTIDYIQQISLQQKGFSMDNKNDKISKIMGELKNLSLTLGIPFLVLSQLNRPSREEEGKRGARLTDLRDSGSLEQDADKVMFLSINEHKRAQMEHDYPNVQITSKKRPVEFEILKQKNGEVGWFPMWLRCPYFRFYGPPEERVGQRLDKHGNMVPFTDYWADDTLTKEEHDETEFDIF